MSTSGWCITQRHADHAESPCRWEPCTCDCHADPSPEGTAEEAAKGDGNDIEITHEEKP